MDYKALKKEGIELAQQLSGEIWTDYNAHDPGVTILEILCYAMTELGYKTHFPIQEILFAKNQKTFFPEDNALYSPDQIFPCNPLTINDYRRIIIDRIPEVTNAWLIPLNKNQLGLNVTGLYKILLQLDQQTQSQQIATQVVEKVKKLFLKHRNLAEDIDEIEVLTPVKIQIEAEINIQNNVVGESLLAEIAFRLSEALTPQIRFLSLEEITEQGLPLQQAFNGPLPIHGFILDQDLEKSDAKVVNQIHKSRLIRMLSEIEGITSVTRFALRQNGERINQEVLKLNHSCYPVLDIENLLDPKNSSLKLYLGDIPYDIDLRATQHFYETLVAKFRQRYHSKLKLNWELPKTDRKLADVKNYDSIQYDFPHTYGVGSYGLNSRASRERKAYAKQLQGYLLFFEQIMGNHLAQLANIRKLFSIKDEDIFQNGKLTQTYFARILFEIPGIQQLLGIPLENEQAKQRAIDKFNELADKFDPKAKRRNQFLNHLLARFGESFMTNAFNSLNRQALAMNQETFDQTLIKAKAAFLQQYISLSRNRGRGRDYSQMPSPKNRAGLKKRIGLFFNINTTHKALADLEQETNLEWGESTNQQSPEFEFQGDPETLLAKTLLHASNPQHYRFQKAKGKSQKTDIFFRNPDSQEEYNVYTADSELDASKALNKLFQKIAYLNEKGEGFHLLEHILLRPIAPLQYSFIIADNNRKLIQSPFIFKANEKLIFINKLLQFGRVKANYEVMGDRNTGYTLALHDKQNQLIAHQPGFAFKKSAKEHLQKIVDFLEKWDTPQTITPFIFRQNQSKKGLVLNTDVYSLKISIIFPAWIARFQHEELRNLLQQVIKLNAPAHLQIHFHWYTLPQMKQFEEIYLQWITEKANPNPNTDKIDQLSLKLIMNLGH